MTEIIDFLLTRSSVKARKLIEPGPSEAQLDMILRASARVPDHGKLNPWRFIVFKGDARAEFGEVLAAAYRKRRPDASDERVEIESTGAVEGDVRSPRLVVQEGAVLNGSVEMGQPRSSADKPKFQAAEPQQAASPAA